VDHLFTGGEKMATTIFGSFKESDRVKVQRKFKIDPVIDNFINSECARTGDTRSAVAGRLLCSGMNYACSPDETEGGRTTFAGKDLDLGDLKTGDFLVLSGISLAKRFLNFKKKSRILRPAELSISEQAQI